jgi:Domain of unknown function (DUF4111)
MSEATGFPTPFPPLNAVLARLVADARAILGANFLGAYLQGSFALDAGDAFSDVDFTIAVHNDVTDEATIAALNAMHARIHSLPEEWAQHLEVSYAPAAVLRNLASAPREVPGFERPPGWIDPTVAGRAAAAYPLLYLNNGANHLVRSEHDNTLVVRWVLRERGIVLAGPHPRELIDPVDPGALRSEVRAIMASFARTLLDGSTLIDPLWLQCFTVLFYCRTLQSLETATIPSKPAAMAWATENLDPRWAPLIKDAWERRADYPRGHGAPAAHAATKADPSAIAETLEFVRYVLELAGIR